MTADQDVSNNMNGSSGTAALPYALVAMLYDANIFGLGKDYAYPEISNTTSSRYDQITTLAKLLTRKTKLADGNSYEPLDMAADQCAKWVLAQNIHINDDEINSVNYVKPKPTS